jgi:hypothetical protein
MSEFNEHYLRGLGGLASNNALTTRQLHPGERRILVTDGIIDRKVKGEARSAWTGSSKHSTAPTAQPQRRPRWPSTRP